MIITLTSRAKLATLSGLELNLTYRKPLSADEICFNLHEIQESGRLEMSGMFVGGCPTLINSLYA